MSRFRKKVINVRASRAGPSQGPDPVTTSDAELGVAGVAEEAPQYSGRSRIIWTFADQGLSSLTNAALAIVVAKNVDKLHFGAFSLALITFGFVVGLVRAFVGEPFVVRFSAVTGAERARATRDASGAAVAMGILATIACLIVAAVAGGDTSATFTGLGISLPGLVLQDTWRHMFFAAGRPKSAAINDLIWTVLQFGLLAALLLHGNHNIFLITLCWGTAALIASLVGCWQIGAVPAPMATLDWLYETRDLNFRLGLGYTLNMGAVTFGTYGIAGIVGELAAGALRAAQVLLGPLNLLFAGFNAFALPIFSRRAVQGQRMVRDAVLGSALLGGLSAVWVVILVLLPSNLGRAVLGDSWAGADQVMLPSGLVLLAGALVLGASNSLAALSRADQVLRVTLVQAPLMLILGLGGAWQWGVVGAAYGFAITQGVGLLYTWVLFMRADADPRRWAS
jgi:O-antigen/teichoic acid export membrane protein